MSNLNIEFFYRPVHYTAESEKVGYPVFKEVAFIRKSVPGDLTTTVERKVTDQDKITFAEAWRRFEAGNTQAQDGFAIEQWPSVSRDQCAALKYSGFHTVESLAEASDGQLQKVGMGGFELRRKAQAHLKAAKDGSFAEQLAAQNQRLEDQITALKNQIAGLGVKPLEDAEQADAPRRGRPRKEAVEA